MLIKELYEVLNSSKIAKLADKYTVSVYLDEKPSDNELMASIEAFLKNKIPAADIKKTAEQIYKQIE